MRIQNSSDTEYMYKKDLVYREIQNDCFGNILNFYVNLFVRCWVWTLPLTYVIHIYFLDWIDDLNINKRHILSIIHWCSLRKHKWTGWKLSHKKERTSLSKWIIFFSHINVYSFDSLKVSNIMKMNLFF